jgi:hypothetical protein
MSGFVARQVTRSYTIRADGQLDEVFSLFDPIGERKWAEDWNPTIIFPASGIAQGAIFVTGKDGSESIWVITKFDKENCNIVYTSVTPNSRVSLIDILCEPNGANRTRARVTYTITALSENGNRYIDSFSKEHYDKWMTHWETAINHYLQYGRALRDH